MRVESAVLAIAKSEWHGKLRRTKNWLAICAVAIWTAVPAILIGGRTAQPTYAEWADVIRRHGIDVARSIFECPRPLWLWASAAFQVTPLAVALLAYDSMSGADQPPPQAKSPLLVVAGKSGAVLTLVCGALFVSGAAVVAIQFFRGAGDPKLVTWAGFLWLCLGGTTSCNVACFVLVSAWVARVRTSMILSVALVLTLRIGREIVHRTTEAYKVPLPSTLDWLMLSSKPWVRVEAVCSILVWTLSLSWLASRHLSRSQIGSPVAPSLSANARETQRAFPNTEQTARARRS
jgi:hypothetical protein